MRLLAIDTALEACSVGVAGGTGPDILISEVIGRGHAERLMGMIEAAMKEARLVFTDLDRIAVTIGPGSFTGVRVGIAAARGLALATNCPVVGVSTLAALADKARAIAGAAPVLAAFDARRRDVYAQSFDETGATVAGPAATPPASAAELLSRTMLLAGSGAPLVAAAAQIPDTRIVHRDAAPEIAAVLRLGAAAAAPEAPPRPLYLRQPDAKPQTAQRIARR